MHFRILNGRALVTERVSGERILQFGYGSDISRVQFGYRHSGLALHDGNVRQLLGSDAREILHGRIVLQHTGKHFEVRNPSRKSIRNSFEDVQRDWLRIGLMTFWRFAVS